MNRYKLTSSSDLGRRTMTFIIIIRPPNMGNVTFVDNSDAYFIRSESDFTSDFHLKSITKGASKNYTQLLPIF